MKPPEVLSMSGVLHIATGFEDLVSGCRVSLSSRLRSQQGTALQMGRVLRYKLEVCCSTF